MRALFSCCCAAALAAAAACKVKDPPPITAAWTDDFDRGDVGGDYYATSDVYHIQSGALGARGAFNHPLWLRKKLPAAVQIDVTVWSNSPDGDLKVELFGDGESHAQDKGQYTSTGYVFVMGGWNNSKSILARGNEHRRDLQQRTTPKVEPGKKYHWRITARGSRLEWFVDDMTTPFLALDDPALDKGAARGYFGFNNWQSDAWFDDLTITPL